MNSLSLALALWLLPLPAAGSTPGTGAVPAVIDVLLSAFSAARDMW